MHSKITPEIRISQRLSDTIEQRFWKYVIKSDGCWVWTGAKVKGYGYLTRGRAGSGNIYAARLSWLIHIGPIPEGKEICHDCPGGDNPACVNPSHLWAGSHNQNMSDMASKGRTVIPCLLGEQHGMHKLTAQQVVEIRSRYKNGEANQYQLAHMYGMKQPTISAIIRRRLWCHI